MHARSLILVALLAGCAAREAAVDRAPPLLESLAPSEDPYAMTFVKASLDPLIERVDRVPGWSDAEHVRALDRFVVWRDRTERTQRPSDLLRFGPTGIALRGTREQNAVLRRFLQDRARHTKAQVYLSLAFLTIDPAREPELDGFRALPSGALWGTLDAARIAGAEAWRVDQAPSLFTLDATRSVIRVGEHAPSVGSYAGVTPFEETAPFAGFAMDAAPALTRDGRLVLRVDAVESAWAETLQPGQGLRGLPVARRRSAFQGRFVLGPGEALLVVKNTPAGLRGLTVRWERVRSNATVGGVGGLLRAPSSRRRYRR